MKGGLEMEGQSTEDLDRIIERIDAIEQKRPSHKEVLEFLKGIVTEQYEAKEQIKVEPIDIKEDMPIGRDGDWTPEKYVSSDEMKSKLETFGPLWKIPRSTHGGPAERYRFESAKGEIGFISPLSHHFCPSCNRLRLTADGKLRPCLFADDEVDIKTPLRNGCSHEDLKVLFQEAIARKPREHHAETLEKGECLRLMSTIGG